MRAVYGPVRSWRHGNSLGVDLIVSDSVCSFNCVYCQLGEINQVTSEQRIFVPTREVIDDLALADVRAADVVTISGSGEPTLALNIGEVIEHIRATYDKPVVVLTNSTWLHDEATRVRLEKASVIECKLDAVDDEGLDRVNRPANGVTHARIQEGIAAMRNHQGFSGRLTLQCMLLTYSEERAEKLGKLVRELRPDEVMLNTPARPKPEKWFFDARGNHGKEPPVPAHLLHMITRDEARAAALIIEQISGLPVRTYYDRPDAAV